MQIIYRKISQFNFYHEVPNAFDSIEVIPTSQTEKLMKNYRIIFKQSGTNCYIIQSCYSNNDPIISIDSDILFRFFIRFNHTLVIGNGDIDLYNPNSHCLYISNVDQSKDIEISKQHIIPVLAELSPGNNLLTSFPQYELVDKHNFSNGIYINSKSEQKYSYFSFAYKDMNGYLDVNYSPFGNDIELINVHLSSRKAFVQYVIFDKYKQYSNFRIESNQFAFKKRYEENKVVLASEEIIQLSELKELVFTLVADRKNGRKTVLRDKMPVPQIDSMTKDDNNNFYVSSFFYL